MFFFKENNVNIFVVLVFFRYFDNFDYNYYRQQLYPTRNEYGDDRNWYYQPDAYKSPSYYDRYYGNGQR